MNPFEGARNVVNVVLLPSMPLTPVIRKAIPKRFQLKIWKKCELAGELEIEEVLESDDEIELPLPTRTKRRRQDCLDGKDSLILEKLFNGKNLILGKICSRTYWNTLFFKLIFITIKIKTNHILWRKYICLLAINSSNFNVLY